jgi:hypothetical protein
MGVLSQTQMKTALWAIPSVAAVGLAMVGLSRVPFERVGWQPPKPPPPPVTSAKPTPPASLTRNESATPKVEQSINTELVKRLNAETTTSQPSAPYRQSPADSSLASKLPASEAALYRSEISFLNSMSASKAKASREAQGFGDLQRAEDYLEDAKYNLSIVVCLQNQASLGIPYYQGKSTCATAVPAPRGK